MQLQFWWAGPLRCAGTPPLHNARAGGGWRRHGSSAAPQAGMRAKCALLGSGLAAGLHVPDLLGVPAGGRAVAEWASAGQEEVVPASSCTCLMPHRQLDLLGHTQRSKTKRSLQRRQNIKGDNHQRRPSARYTHWSMVRSEEKKPLPAVYRMERRVHSSCGAGRGGRGRRLRRGDGGG